MSAICLLFSNKSLRGLNTENAQSKAQILLILVYKGHQKSHFQVWRFVTAVANHNCLNLPATFMQPGNDTSGEPCAAGNEGLPSSFHSQILVQIPDVE